MPIFRPAERAFVQAVARLTHCNPFVPERIDCEKEVLGEEFDASQNDWNLRPGEDRTNRNLERLLVRCETLLEQVRQRLDEKRSHLAADDLALYEDLLLAPLYHRFRFGLDELMHGADGNAGPTRAGKLYRELTAYAARYLCFDDRQLPLFEQLPHLFAGFFQIRRAFENIFRLIIGVSRPAVRLRAAVWESIFTHDMRRYRRVLFARMADYTTLVTGLSGTGKELVAQAIGYSRYIPFNPKTGAFSEEFAGSFYPISISALSPTLIESELFGHRRGSFTGAVADRKGWLETCPVHGAVFLDEIGELDQAIQVKLLRVLQSRKFSRLGETDEQKFEGKIIAATNRNLADEMQSGQFRADFYYRLCSDMVETPSLAARIADNPDELRHLVNHLSERALGAEGQQLASEVFAWIESRLGIDYPWPGNIRELEQCVWNVLIRHTYVPAQSSVPAAPADSHDELFSAIAAGSLTADELLRRYCSLVFAATGSYEATARQLKLDRRTVRAKVDPQLIESAKSARRSPLG